MDKKITAITILWIINELLQLTKLLQEYSIVKFSVIHLSSLYGAFVFCSFLSYLKFSRLFIITPIAIELFKSWNTCHCIDGWDLVFSMAGILLYYIMIVYYNYLNPSSSNLFGK